MLHRLREARLLGPAMMTALGLAMLLALGIWQMQRKVWKETLIATITERTKADPVDLVGAYTATHSPAEDAIGLEYLRVKARGHFLHDKERYFYAPDPDVGPGFNVYTPLEMSGGTVVFVNRGFVPDDKKDAATRAAGQTPGEVDVVGLVRQAGNQARFTPDNDAKNNIWFWRDIVGLKASAFPQGRDSVIPLIIDQEKTASTGDGPKGGTTIVTLTNRHLEYAITWFGLAITLAAVFAVFAAGRLRATDARGAKAPR